VRIGLFVEGEMVVMGSEEEADVLLVVSPLVGCVEVLSWVMIAVLGSSLYLKGCPCEKLGCVSWFLKITVCGIAGWFREMHGIDVTFRPGMSYQSSFNDTPVRLLLLIKCFRIRLIVLLHPTYGSRSSQWTLYVSHALHALCKSTKSTKVIRERYRPNAAAGECCPRYS